MTSIGGLFKDILFPKFCVSCRQEGAWLCSVCLRIVLTTERLPSQLDIITPDSLDGVTALFSYTGTVISKLIELLKYNFLLEAGEDLKTIIINTDFKLPYSDFAIMPTPLHPRRERERGFNQAAVLAEIFSQKLQLPIIGGLTRSIYTTQQATLSRIERNKNLADAFIFTPEENNVPEKVLLVDDVFTTGATMHECAKALKNAGVKIVWGLAIAHG